MEESVITERLSVCDVTHRNIHNGLRNMQSPYYHYPYFSFLKYVSNWATHLTILFSDIIDLLCNYMVSIILSRPINFVV